MSAYCTIPMDVAPYHLSGVVYGALNHQSVMTEVGGKVTEPPYLVGPRAPVLYIKPRNTLTESGSVVTIPTGSIALELGACLGMVIGRYACNLTAEEALDSVAGYVLINDVSVPHSVFYRPSVRFKAQNGFCPIGPAVVPRTAIADPGLISIRTYVDGVLVQETSTSQLIRSPATLLSGVTEFMTLAPGDILALGAARPAPLVHAGQVVDIKADGIGTLTNRFAVST